MLMFPYRPAKRVHKRKALQLGRIASLFLALPLAHTAYAADQWAISANDGHTTTNPAGKMITAETIVPDNLSLIRFDQGRPILGKSTTLPTSVEGPPTTAWIAPDSSWAIITAGSRAGLHPGDPVIEDDIVSIVTIDKAAPHLVQTVHAGLGASQISVSPDQNWALVGNRKSGTVSVFSIKNKKLSLTQTISMGEKSNPASVLFLPDGQHAVVVLRGPHQLALLRNTGQGFQVDTKRLDLGRAPNTMDRTRSGLIAIGDQDAAHPAVHLVAHTNGALNLLSTTAVASSPEPLRFSPDGRYLAVGAVNNSNKDPSKHGTLTLYRVDGKALTPLATENVGRWPQGIIFSPNGHTLLVQNTTDKTMTVLQWDGMKLHATGTLAMPAGPAAAATSW
ncbi:beta-propeller fold lactonase family protein [Acetobacter senegalensis]|uniref:beta-propeller fold lactonase family protein n=1 Tax=Acetobacter senegalensis TaxID=446692 RepID=UPI001EE0D6FE|nr:beta-propeller fold lactonase family protein [Acetobacter senegalensis]MCG4273163.1 lactonase family protein [Acetobacter senegalensis]